MKFAAKHLILVPHEVVNTKGNILNFKRRTLKKKSIVLMTQSYHFFCFSLVFLPILLSMNKQIKQTKSTETNNQLKKQVLKNISETKTEVKKADSKNQKTTSKIKKIFQQKSGKVL